LTIFSAFQLFNSVARSIDRATRTTRSLGLQHSCTTITISLPDLAVILLCLLPSTMQ
jgi:hypothetical protein